MPARPGREATAQARLATWNVRWATPSSDRGQRIASLLTGLGADVICLTEGCAGLLPPGGHLIDAGSDWGYPTVPARRKVILWSRRPWRAVSSGSADLPPGRYVTGTTATAAGDLVVCGVCVPWRLAHVRGGHGHATAWSEHRAYLAALGPVLASGATPRIVLGDLNQRIPRRRVPVAVAAALEGALAGMTVVTAGTPPPVGEALIDHVALSSALRAREVRSWSRMGEDGRALSDHHGVGVVVERVP